MAAGDGRAGGGVAWGSGSSISSRGSSSRAPTWQMSIVLISRFRRRRRTLGYGKVTRPAILSLKGGIVCDIYDKMTFGP